MSRERDPEQATAGSPSSGAADASEEKIADLRETAKRYSARSDVAIADRSEYRDAIVPLSEVIQADITLMDKPSGGLFETLRRTDASRVLQYDLPDGATTTLVAQVQTQLPSPEESVALTKHLVVAGYLFAVRVYPQIDFGNLS